MEGVNERVGNEVKEQKGKFLDMLATTFWGSVWTGKRVVTGGSGINGVDEKGIRAGEGQDF